MKNELITALYCRTALACDESIAIQEARLRQYAEENNYGNVSVYTDNGFSGLNYERPAIKQLQTDVACGMVGVVLVRDVSRITRNHLDFPSFIDSMESSGVIVKFIVNGLTYGETISISDEIRQMFQVFHANSIKGEKGQ